MLQSETYEANWEWHLWGWVMLVSQCIIENKWSWAICMAGLEYLCFRVKPMKLVWNGAFEDWSRWSVLQKTIQIKCIELLACLDEHIENCEGFAKQSGYWNWLGNAQRKIIAMEEAGLPWNLFLVSHGIAFQKLQTESSWSERSLVCGCQGHSWIFFEWLGEFWNNPAQLGLTGIANSTYT